MIKRIFLVASFNDSELKTRKQLHFFQDLLAAKESFLLYLAIKNTNIYACKNANSNKMSLSCLILRAFFKHAHLQFSRTLSLNLLKTFYFKNIYVKESIQ